MNVNDFVIDLPPAWSSVALLAFHARDPQQIAERTGPDWLEKAFIWQQAPAWLRLDFQPGRVRGRFRGRQGEAGALQARVAHMLGLSQAVEQFEAQFADDPQLGPLLARQQGLRIPQSATPFEALSWAITGQQISVAAALSVRRRMILAVGAVHDNGLHCYPDAAAMARLGEAGLRACGFSTAKAACLSKLATAVAEERIVLPGVDEAPDEARLEALLGGVRGIGPWTRQYTLLRGYASLSASLHGDVAVRRGIEHLPGMSAPVTPAAAAAWLARFHPWQALVAVHLWAAAASAP